MRALRAPTFAFDDSRKYKKDRADFRAGRKTEAQLGVKLRRIAGYIEDVVRMMADGSLDSAYRIDGLMRQYAETLGPWANAVMNAMHAEAAARDKAQWHKYSQDMGLELRRQIDQAPLGEMLWQLLDEQAGLVKSIPLDAARRVHDLTVEGLSSGARSSSIVDEIMRQGEVSRNKATLIARTESARTASLLTQARSIHLGVTSYTWETSRDGTVRASHRALQGKVFSWSDPPECDPGHYANPGQIWNCRCWARPLLNP